jgi:hypothetical protein
MAKTKISEFSSTAADNTDITNINIAEGCSPANVNNAIRSLMSILKNFEDGSSGDSIVVGGNLRVDGTTTLVGTAVAPTPSPGDNSTKIATTAFVQTKVGTLGTMATQNATAVAITGGTITGITDLTVADGGTGASTITANSVILGNGASALSGNLVAPSTSGNVLTSNGTTWTSTALNKLTSGTAQASTSGTSIDFTGIPSWAKRVTIMFSTLSTNGTSLVMIQVGSGSIVTSGYASSGAFVGTVTDGVNISEGLVVGGSPAAADLRSGQMIISLLNSNTWVASCAGGQHSANYSFVSGGKTPTLSGALDRVRITTLNGTDAFDSGSINIMYE